MSRGKRMYKKGDAILCWTEKEAILRYYQLASMGIIAKHDEKEFKRLIIEKGDEDDT